jgi:hypothetical protein
VPGIAVIHYEPGEAEALAGRIRREGFEALACPLIGSKAVTWVRQQQPDAVVIDLMRLPSYGRAIGALLREGKSTRGFPLVFIEGDPEKTKLVRKLLPDAVFTNVLRIRGDLEKAIRTAPVDPVVPDATRVPAAKKLRIAEGATVALLHAPENFKLAPLPKKVKLQSAAAGATIVLLFARSPIDLARELPRLGREAESGKKVWVLWPKKASGAQGDLTMQRVWQACAGFGLAPNKLCAVDATWSALAVAVKRHSRNRTGGAVRE